MHSTNHSDSSMLSGASSKRNPQLLQRTRAKVRVLLIVSMAAAILMALALLQFV